MDVSVIMLELGSGISLPRILFALKGRSRFVFLLKKDICIAVTFFILHTRGVLLPVTLEEILGFYACLQFD